MNEIDDIIPGSFAVMLRTHLLLLNHDFIDIFSRIAFICIVKYENS